MGPKRRTPSKSPRRDSATKKQKDSETKRRIDEVDDVDEEVNTPKKSNRGRSNEVVTTDSRGRSKSPAPVAPSSPTSTKSKKQAPKSSGKNSKPYTPVKSSDTASNDGGSPVRTKAAAHTKAVAASTDINTIKLKSKISLYNIKSSRKRYSDQIWEDEEELSSGYAGLVVVIVATIAFFYFYGAKIDLLALLKLPYEYLEKFITNVLGRLTDKVPFFSAKTNGLLSHLASFMINMNIIYTALFIPIVYYLFEKDHTSPVTYLAFTLFVFVGLSYYHHQCTDLECFKRHADDVLAHKYFDPFGAWFSGIKNTVTQTISSLLNKK